MKSYLTKKELKEIGREDLNGTFLKSVRTNSLCKPFQSDYYEGEQQGNYCVFYKGEDGGLMVETYSKQDKEDFAVFKSVVWGFTPGKYCNMVLNLKKGTVDTLYCWPVEDGKEPILHG